MGFSYSGHSNSMINGKLIALRPGLTIIILKVTPDHRRLTDQYTNQEGISRKDAKTQRKKEGKN